VICELVQSVGVVELTRESTKTESSITDAYNKPKGDARSHVIDPVLDAMRVTVHTGWYVQGTQESQT
jgi:hypothetical protein